MTDFMSKRKRSGGHKGRGTGNANEGTGTEEIRPGSISQASLRPAPQRYPLGSTAAVPIQSDPSRRSPGESEPLSDAMWSAPSRFAPGVIKDRAMHLYMRPYVSLVRRSVAPNGGTTNFKFSQCKGAVNREIMRHRGTTAGVCQSLTAHWLRDHVAGQSFFGRLYPEGRRGSLNDKELHSVKKLAIDGDAAPDQDKHTDQWLYDETVGQLYGAGYDVYKQKLDVAGPSGMIDRILETKQNRPRPYKIISLHGRWASHAVAVHIQPHADIIWFDPNFGEFQFPDSDSFRHWFLNAYWPRSGYRWSLVGLSEAFSIVSYVHFPASPTTSSTADCQ